MNRCFTVLLVGILFLTFLAPVTTATVATASKSLELGVYSDGYVFVTQVLTVDPRVVSIQVPLLSSVVSSLVATDQNGSPLSYGFSSHGTNITVYTLGASSVTLRYDTNNLTSKTGTVWTLTFASRYNSTVILPQFSTLVSVSGTPYSINETNMSPKVTLSPGAWKVTYGVTFVNTAASTSNSTSGGGQGPLSLTTWVEVAAALVVAVGGGASILWWRGRRIGLSKDLRPDDVQVLNFIQEKGGRVQELEIRTRFALPKTSAWRQIKRLERLGYVKVTKIGTQNQIEVVKERKPD